MSTLLVVAHQVAMIAQNGSNQLRTQEKHEILQLLRRQGSQLFGRQTDFIAVDIGIGEQDDNTYGLVGHGRVKHQAISGQLLRTFQERLRYEQSLEELGNVRGIEESDSH